MRRKVTISYDGSGYNGFQRQGNEKTIQFELEKALTTIAKTPIVIHASGRTDARVHAENQVFHFDCDIDMRSENWKRALNSLLPSDIYVKQVEEVNRHFHARFDVKTKEYRYLLSTKDFHPMQAKFIFQYGHHLDVPLMQRAANLFVGEHDFKSFCSNKNEDTLSFVRTIHCFEVTQANGIIEFRVIGTGFLRYMVRMMVGTLIEIGRGRKTLDEIISRLDQLERNIVSHNAPACGLILQDVTYYEPIHNYHTHTNRCMHAKGSDEDYVQAAIANHIKTLGFSDHLMSPNIKEEWKMRGRPEQLEEYLSSIRTLQANYHDYIDIHIGMECEYFPALEPELRDLLTSGRCEYLILGLHYLYQNEQGLIEDYSGDITTKEQLLRYGDLASEAMRTGLFTIFAHPDLFMARYPIWDATCEKISRQICEAAKEQGVLLEVNLRGIYFFGEKTYRDGKRNPYPHEAFFKIAKEMGNQVIIGMDAHDPQELTPDQYKRGETFLKSLDYKAISKITRFKGQS